MNWSRGLLILALHTSQVADSVRPPPPIDPKEFDCLSQAVYYEAGVETVRGMYMVAEVILNRVHTSRWPNNVCGVIYQHRQFSAAPRLHIPPYPGRKWELAKLVALDSLQGTAPNLLSDDVYFYHRHDVKPSWSRSMKIANSTANHIFLEEQ